MSDVGCTALPEISCNVSEGEIGCVRVMSAENELGLTAAVKTNIDG